MEFPKEIVRCPWCGTDETYMKYHDEEWGVPVFDDHTMFSQLVLETFQAGLSWITILKKRENFREAFDNFDIDTIANYDSAKVAELLKNDGIIRNKLKIVATIGNAKSTQRIIRDFGSLSNYFWSFVNYKPESLRPRYTEDVPAVSILSDEISKDLKKRGFKFVGSTIVYAHLQAVGLVNDHLTGCSRFEEVEKMGKVDIRAKIKKANK